MSDALAGAGLVFGHRQVEYMEYEIRPNTHRHVHSESSIDERDFPEPLCD
jgi:hypothetical protein